MVIYDVPNKIHQVQLTPNAVINDITPAYENCDACICKHVLTPPAYAWFGHTVISRL